MGLQGPGNGELLAFGLVTLAILAAVAGVCSLMYIFAATTCRAERAARVSKTFAKIVVVAAMIALVVNYAFDIRLRSGAHDCERKSSNDGRYVAELCLLRDNGHDADYVGRVYDARNNELLVERTFDAPETELLWFSGQISFMRGGDDSDAIHLPPSWLDRLRSKLP